jgi:hypothetical protein
VGVVDVDVVIGVDVVAIGVDVAVFGWAVLVEEAVVKFGAEGIVEVVESSAVVEVVRMCVGLESFAEEIVEEQIFVVLRFVVVVAAVVVAVAVVAVFYQLKLLNLFELVVMVVAAVAVVAVLFQSYVEGRTLL